MPSEAASPPVRSQQVAQTFQVQTVVVHQQDADAGWITFTRAVGHAAHGQSPWCRPPAGTGFRTAAGPVPCSHDGQAKMRLVAGPLLADRTPVRRRRSPPESSRPDRKLSGCLGEPGMFGGTLVSASWMMNKQLRLTSGVSGLLFHVRQTGLHGCSVTLVIAPTGTRPARRKRAFFRWRLFIADAQDVLAHVAMRDLRLADQLLPTRRALRSSSPGQPVQGGLRPCTDEAGEPDQLVVQLRPMRSRSSSVQPLFAGL